MERDSAARDERKALGRAARASTDRRNAGGRRADDELPRVTFTKKVAVLIVGGVNAFYLVSELLLFGQDHCP